MNENNCKNFHLYLSKKTSAIRNFNRFDGYSETLLISPNLISYNKRGFTLAETLVALTVIGIIASITVPALVKRQGDKTNRVKIKKAISVYDTMMNNIVAENGIKSNVELENFLTANNCNNIANYLRFKERDNCTFKTYDDVYWQFPTEYNNEGKVYAMVGFKESNVNSFNSADAFRNYSIQSGDPIFELSSTFSNGGFHVNDGVAFSNNSNKEHLYNYINNQEQVSYNKVTAYVASENNQQQEGNSGSVSGGSGKPGAVEKPTLSTDPTVNAR